MGEGHVKCLGLQSALTAFSEAFPSAVTALERNASVELRRFLERPPLASAWLPVGLLFELLTAMRIAGQLTLEDLEALGQRSLQRDLSTVARFFVRFSSVDFVLKRSAALWSAYYDDFGNVTHSRPQPGVVEVLYGQMPGATEEFFAFHRGAALALIVASGHPRATKLDSVLSQDACLFKFSLGD